MLEKVIDLQPGYDVSQHGVAQSGPAHSIREYLSDLYRLSGDYRNALTHAQTLRQEQPQCPRAAKRQPTPTNELAKGAALDIPLTREV